MNNDELQVQARERANELPGVGLERPFGPEREVFTVRDKVFRLTEMTGEPLVIVKAAPEDGKALRQLHEHIKRPVVPATFGSRDQ